MEIKNEQRDVHYFKRDHFGFSACGKVMYLGSERCTNDITAVTCPVCLKMKKDGDIKYSHLIKFYPQW